MAILGIGKRKSTETAQKIGKKELKHFDEILQKYREGKSSIEARAVENEEWWKLHQWEQTQNGNKNDIQPRGAYLWNTIEVKHADVTAAYPEPTVRPRNQDDIPEAEKLSSILPVVLEQNEFRRVWSEVNKYKLKQGTGIYGVFWDGDRLGGLGDIAIKKIDILRIFWEPGVTDIQSSRYVFLVDLWDIDRLEAQYPEHAGNLKNGGKMTVKNYLYDDNVDTTDKAVVVDVYYKVQQNGRTVLHYCKYCGNCVLYATENDTAPSAALSDSGNETAPDAAENGAPCPAQNGLYDHGLYPFVFDPLFEVEGSVAGYGYIDIGKSIQSQIDLMDQAFLKSTLANCTPRYMISGNTGVNEEEFADFTRPFVHFEGALTDINVREIPQTSLSGNFLDVYQLKVNELKEVLGNRDVANGGTTSGVTAASAIATLQEVSGRMSKDSTRDAYRAFKGVINLCIELIRQFYTVPRTFRIIGEGGMQKFITYTNAGLGEQAQSNIMGVKMGMRLPVFDIEVSAQNATEYTKQSQNEMALQFFSLGFFNPALSDQALACLETMDFDHKDDVMDRVSKNGLLYQRLQQMQQIAIGLASKYEPELAQALIAQGQADMGGVGFPEASAGEPWGVPSGAPMAGGAQISRFAGEGEGASERVGFPAARSRSGGGSEHPNVKRARAAAQNAAQPEGAS